MAMIQNEVDKRTLSFLTGIDVGLIGVYLDGVFEPSDSEYSAFSKVLNVPKAWLRGEEISAELIEIDEIPDNRSVRYIPLYESVSAGLGSLANEDIVDYIPLSIKSEAEAKETFCVRVKGDSMTPYIQEGDILQVHKQNIVDSGDIAIVHVDEIEIEGFVKKVVYKDNWLELRSANTSYNTRRFERKERDWVKIVGLVKKIIRDVKK